LAAISLVVLSASHCNDIIAGHVLEEIFGFEISLVQPIVVAYTGQVTVTVNVNRHAGVDGAIDLHGSITGDGVFVTDGTIARGANSATLTIRTNGTSKPGEEINLTVRASAPGYEDSQKVAPVSILKAGTFVLTEGDNNTFANPGFTFRKRILIIRDQFTSPVTFSLKNPLANYPATFSPQPASGNFVDLDMSVPASATLKAGEMVVEGTGADGIVHSVAVNWTMRAPSFTITASGPAAPVTVGSSGQAGVSVLRDPGFTGAINLTANIDGKLTVAPVTIPAGATQATLAFKVEQNADLGPHDIPIIATGVGAVSTGTTFVLKIRGFKENAGFEDVIAGASAHQVDTVAITRDDFPDAVVVTSVVANGTGITTTPNPSSTTGNTSILTVSALGSVAPGTYVVTVTGTSGTATAQWITQLIVKAAVVPPASPSLVVYPKTVSISAGRQSTLTGVVSNGLNVTDVAWSSKDPTIASVVANGSRAVTVTGVKAGSSTYVIGTYDYFGGTSRDSTLVTVTGASTAQVDHITLEPDSSNVANGQQVQYRVRYWNASNAEMNGEAGNTTAFTVDVSSVAQIGSSTGLLTTRGLGSSFVNASYRMPYYDSLVPVKVSLFAKAKVVVR
jgi:hypothetical protein